jgi:hypothetical protein
MADRILDLFVTHNPLLAHGPRTHSTGIVLEPSAPAPRRPRARWDVDAPRVHLGHAGRSAR